MLIIRSSYLKKLQVADYAPIIFTDAFLGLHIQRFVDSVFFVFFS